ncbi:hypothetical protein HY642_02820 [Candidatus Woesearchaeota archaeon]|nr:hypothetical protein [Candidatus Woesearchaeota archaeon]
MDARQLQDAEAQLSQVADQLKILSNSTRTVTQNLALVLMKLERLAPELEVERRKELQDLTPAVQAQVAECRHLLDLLARIQNIRLVELDLGASELRASMSQTMKALGRVTS